VASPDDNEGQKSRNEAIPLVLICNSDISRQIRVDSLRHGAVLLSVDRYGFALFTDVLEFVLFEDRIASHHITSHHITSHHITSHLITSHLITSRHITSHHITSHHITSHHITSHHITSHHITSHHITSHHIASRVTRYRFTNHVSG
jgi:hypothetical protein